MSSLRSECDGHRLTEALSGFRSPAAKAAAHEFTMPAMSPTMTEGNIASWKVKEGTQMF